MVLDDGDLAFRRRIHDLVSQGRTKVVVDLGGVAYMDSSGVGMLAAKLKTVRESGGNMSSVGCRARARACWGC